MEKNVEFRESSNIILAEGKLRRPSGLWFALGAATVALLAFCAWFLFSISRPIPIPDSPTLLLSLTPAAMERLPEEIGSAMPAAIDLDRPSRWPVVLGLYHDNGLWKYFVAGPSWALERQENGQTIRNGLVSIYYPDPLPKETKPFGYLGHIPRRGLLPTPLAFELDSNLLFASAGIEGSGERIRGRLRGNVLETDISFSENGVDPQSLREADVAIHIPKNDTVEQTLRDLIRRLSNGRHAQAESPDLDQLHVWLDENGRPDQIIYTFEEDLSEMQAAMLLGAYGFSSTRTIVLPDGTTSIERIAIASTGTEPLWGNRTNSAGERLALSRREFSVTSKGEASAAFPLETSCPSGLPWLRLSGETIALLLRSLGWDLAPDSLPSLQFADRNEKLIICVE